MSGTSLRHRAYQHIYRKIADGHLPAGSQVSELSLAREIGISRTPVREAIRRLALEGLVEQVPRYGTIVREPDRQEMAELYEVREALESYAAATAARRIAPPDVERMRRLHGQMFEVAEELRASGNTALDDSLLRQFLAADLGFHLVVIHAAGNRRLMKIVVDTQALTRIFRHRRQVHGLSIVRRACRYHGEILRAVEARDPAAARRWTARHIRASKRQALSYLDRPGDAHAGELIALDLPEHLLVELNGRKGAATPRPPSDAVSDDENGST